MDLILLQVVLMDVLEHLGAAFLLGTQLPLTLQAVSRVQLFVPACLRQELVVTVLFLDHLSIHHAQSIILLVIYRGGERLLMVLQQRLMLLDHLLELVVVKRELVVMEFSQEVIQAKLAMLDVQELLGGMSRMDIQAQRTPAQALLQLAQVWQRPVLVVLD